ncbi:hypothetical protein [Devosia aquimaris]|uniref:hypothetical protein n=1 Tax=Devosia aquimaris TaxID=2866214 RepID=UPI001CD19250|nr:hypothetical protein [Devosia sp. CJK-A8-3]
MLSSIASATAGMTRAADRLEASANRVARFGTGLADVDLPTEAVEVTMAQADFKANASVVRVADAMAKATINILA